MTTVTSEGTGDSGARSPATAIRDALADAIDEVADPVHDANANEPAPPQVDTELCDTVLTMAGNGAYFAVHYYQGRSAVDLAPIHAVLNGASQVEGYPGVGGAAVYLRDGSAAVFCSWKGGNPGGAPAPTSVTFVLPAR